MVTLEGNMARNRRAVITFPNGVTKIRELCRQQQLKGEVISQLVPVAVTLNGKRVAADRNMLRKAQDDVEEAMNARAPQYSRTRTRSVRLE